MAAQPVPSFTRRVLLVFALAVVAILLWKIAPVLMLGFAGIVLATAVRAGADPLERHLGLPQAAAVGIVFFASLAVVVGGSYLFGREIQEQTDQLWTALVDATDKIKERMEDWTVGSWLIDNATGSEDPEAMSKAVKGTFTIFGAVADAVLVVFLALYFAVDPKSYKRGFLHLVPTAWRGRVDRALESAGDALHNWLKGQFVAMVVVGVLTALGLWIVGVPLAIPLGVLSGLLDFVPFIGPIVAAVPGLLVAFAQGEDVALYAALVYIAVQFIEGNIVMPMAQKWAVSLPPVLSLLGIVGFGLVFGPLGLLFAMPLTVVLVVLVQKLYVERLDKS